MGWTGKTIGAIAGSAFGPLGAVFGAWVGHGYDQQNDAAEAAQQEDLNNRSCLFAIGVCAAYADGVLQTNERKRLIILAQQLFGSCPETEIDQHIAHIRHSQFGVNECAQSFTALNREAQASMDMEIIAILFSDSHFTDSEYNWLNQFVRLTGSNPADWQNLMQFYDRAMFQPFDRNACLKTLGLAPQADAQAIRNAYRQLAREYHPDRLAQVPAAVRSLAEDKLRELNAAYEALTKQTNDRESLSQFAAQIAPTITENPEHYRGGEITHCFLCGQKNRLPVTTQMLTARCGQCYALLLLPKQIVG